ncbi:MAG: SseB family protein [Spirochaetaceae bacterium]|nr:SseB family protein [Spirochaetaceae bacterium]
MTVPGQPSSGEAKRGRRTRTTESAIAAGMAAGDDEAVMRAVAQSEIVVPQTPEGAPEQQGEIEKGTILLPVIEQDGTSYVPVFTSERTMNETAPDIEDAVTVEAADLAANWPTGELWLAVNPGTDEAVTLPPEAVRSLPTYTEDPVE